MSLLGLIVQLVLCLLSAAPAAGAEPANSRDAISIDASEAQATLAILAKLRHSATVTKQDWDSLFSTPGYRRLRQREAQFKRTFTDDDFKAFVTRPKLVAEFEDLQNTLQRWTSADIGQLVHRSLAYLPTGSTIHATVYPLIKPRTNSFVYELDTDPAIMLYLDPGVTKDQFGNTVSHELFHVGDAQNCPPPQVRAQEHSLKPTQKSVRDWLSAFGEGSAVLAAAGGPDVHPHAVDPAADGAVWDRAMTHYNSDFETLQQFFTDIADGKLKGDAIAEKGYTFFGEVQGPWYTVGYKMDVTIERAFGRARLIEVLCDKREYFSTYNAAATKSSDASSPLPLWSSKLTTLFDA